MLLINFNKIQNNNKNLNKIKLSLIFVNYFMMKKWKVYHKMKKDLDILIKITRKNKKINRILNNYLKIYLINQNKYLKNKDKKNIVKLKNLKN